MAQQHLRDAEGAGRVWQGVEGSMRRMHGLGWALVLLGVVSGGRAEGAPRGLGSASSPGFSAAAAAPGASGVAAKAGKAPVQPLLPRSFGAEQVAGVIATQTGPSAASVDAGHAALLREDGVLDAAQANYAGEAGAISVRAFRFGDATGAYAAFTAYRAPGMRRQLLGADGASASSGEGDRYLFWKGATLVEASVKGASAGHALVALNALAAGLPVPTGSASIPPPLRGYLPTAKLEPESVHYAIGPAGYATAGSPLPESVIDFSRDAEVVVARYKTGSGAGTLVVLNYPTPQMATSRQKAIESLIRSGAAGLAVGDPGLVVERIGPLVAFTGGGFGAAEAQGLIRSIHYEAAVTINHPEGYVSEVSKAAKLLLGIGYLTIILFVAAVLLAFFLGAGRVLIRRMRGKPDSSMNDDDFISLKIG